MTRQRWFAIVAAGSLILNLLLAGFIGAQWLRGAAGPPAWRIAQMAATNPSGAAVTAKLRANLAEALAAPDASGAPLSPADVAAARAAVPAALRAEPFDPGALDGALAQMRAMNQRTLERFHGAIEATAAQLTSDERHDLARFLERVGAGGPGMMSSGPGAPLSTRGAPPQR